MGQVDSFQRLYLAHRDRFEFFLVYIREAHPEELPASSAPLLDQRFRFARELCASHHLQIPVLIDDADDGAAQRYSAWPERAYVIGPDGTVEFASTPGFGPNFNLVEELRRALEYVSEL